ncbi:hypothetical protein I552_8740 [Mycobacterium xenopi 3993]|nr:hypothetical protein I552_8740 [Mycobacterium xenopi 3993]
MGAGVADCRDDVVGVVRLYDHIGKPLWHNAIPYRFSASCLVAWCAAKERLVGREQSHCVTSVFARSRVVDR